MFNTKWFYGGEDLTDARKIRQEVFVIEQNVDPEIEYDELDKVAVHLVLYENGVPVGTGRAINKDGEYYIGRLAVLKDFRKKGYGDLIMRVLIRKCFDAGGDKQYIHAQKHAENFYKKLGFTPYGEPFAEAGIEHIHMVREGDIGHIC